MQGQPVTKTGMWPTYTIVIIVLTIVVIVTAVATVITDAVNMPVTLVAVVCCS